MTTLEDLIREGVEIRERRIANEIRRREEAAAREERERRESAERILALLPKPVRPLAEVEFPTTRLDCARVRIAVPQGGEVGVYLEREGGNWLVSSDDDYYYRRQRISTYLSRNPDGYSLRFFSFEEALAYAAGAFEV